MLSSLEAGPVLLAERGRLLIKRRMMTEETEFNPYAPPQAARLVDESPEAIRRAHIGHETSIKAVGGLYALFGGLMLLPVIIGMLEALSAASSKGDFAAMGLAAIIGACGLVLGAGVFRLRAWARIPMAVVSGLLGAVTIFTVLLPLMNGYVGWLMLSAKGRMIFSLQYQAVIAFTPDVNPRTSVVSLCLLFVVMLLVLAVMAALLLPVFRR
ncbi:hypothetical protein [Prosthecobacter sp.]|uniref:hypothetical protein n=1 Tax=Prosthecobacter sp. TaxID=1965333 RepID=UPI002AC97E63|nr:hypothetical protein [Prosthecobacter sp.]